MRFGLEQTGKLRQSTDGADDMVLWQAGLPKPRTAHDAPALALDDKHS
jgi:hypothetical protein